MEDEKTLKELKTLVDNCTQNEKNASIFLQLFDEKILDNPGKHAVQIIQLGYAILLDKPIIIIAPLGTKVPENIKRVAKTVEFYEPNNLESIKKATAKGLIAAGILSSKPTG